MAETAIKWGCIKHPSYLNEIQSKRPAQLCWGEGEGKWGHKLLVVFPQIQGQNKPPQQWQGVMAAADRVVGNPVSAEAMKAGMSGNCSDSQGPIKF